MAQIIGQRGTRTFNRRRVLFLLSSVLSLLLSGLVLLTIGYYRDYRKCPAEPLIGNKASNLKALKENGRPFSFLVIGDTHNSGRARSLIRRAVKGGEASFMVILGDFVKEPSLWQHRFFLTDMAVRIKPPFPVFLIPGDHDIAYGSKTGKAKGTVTPEIYESLYGPRNSDFVFNNCLFILGSVDLSNPEDYLNYLQKTLSGKGKGKRHIFVFIHYPPKGLAGFIEGVLPREEEFFSLLETYHVTSCFFGDYHGYWRGQRKGTSLVVSGGGGRFKSYQPEWGRFHHILKVNVDKTGLSEEVMILGTTFDLESRFEEMIFERIFPLIEKSGWTLYALLAVLLCWGGYSVIIFAGDLRKRPYGR
jgi:hypothetical protein